jgi:hypothetical protein
LPALLLRRRGSMSHGARVAARPSGATPVPNLNATQIIGIGRLPRPRLRLAARGLRRSKYQPTAIILMEKSQEREKEAEATERKLNMEEKRKLEKLLISTGAL